MLKRLMVAALGATLAVALPAGPATADGGSAITLDLDGFVDLTVASASDRLFFSQGSQSDNVGVTDLAGDNETIIKDALPDARGMTVSPDGSTLYVALKTKAVIAAVDTRTLAVKQHYSVAPARNPSWLTMPTADKIYFGYVNSYGKGTVGSLDVSGDQPEVAVDLLRLSSGNGYYDAPVVRSTPTRPNLLVVTEGGTAGITKPGRPRVYDLSSGTPVLKASTDPTDCQTLADAALTPDGNQVILACSHVFGEGEVADRHVALSTTDLTVAAEFPSARVPWAVTTSPDGAFVIAGAAHALDNSSAIHVGRRDGTLVHRYDLPTGTTLERRGLAMSGDSKRLYAVTTDSEDAVSLRVLTDFAQTGSTLTLDGPAEVQAYDSVTITGRLDVHGESTSAQRLQVTRRSIHGTVSLPDVTTAPDGTFTITDPSVPGASHTYTVSYPGDATHSGSISTHKVNAEDVLSAITLSAPASSGRTARLTVTGKLSFTGTGTHTGQDVPVKQPRTVRVTKKDLAGTYTLPAVTTTATGTFSFTDTPAVGGAVTYTATYDGYGTWVASSRTATVQVSRAATPLGIATNAGAYSYGRTATVTAKLGTTYNGRSICLYAQAYGSARTTLKCGLVSSAGTLSATYVVNRRTTFSAWFPGDHRYAPVTVARTVSSYAYVTQQLTGNSSTSGGYKVFRRTVNPKLTVAIAAPAPTACVYVTMQKYSSGAWRTVSTSSCLRLDAASRAGYSYTGSRSTGVNYRLQVRFGGSSANVATYGAPLHLRFTS